MKKENSFFCKFDLVLWTFIALLPVLWYGLFIFHSAGTESTVTFMSFIQDKFGFFVSFDNVISQSIKGIFGESGTFPIFNDTLISYFTYFIVVEILHIVVDVLCFIPRFAHKLMTKFTEI